MKDMMMAAAIVWWAHGVAVAKGFWLTAACFILPPAAWVVSMMEMNK